MKTYLIVLISFITISFSFAQVRNLTDPIPGCDVKVGRKPPGGIIATGKTGADGTYEFKNLSSGKGYFVTVDYGISEKGIKSTSRTIKITDIEISKKQETYTKKMKQGSGKPETRSDNSAIKTEEFEIVLTVIAGNGTIKVKHDTVKNSISNIR